MQTEVPPQLPPQVDGQIAPDEATLENDAAKSSTRRGPRIIGRLRFFWSWIVAGALLLFVGPLVLLTARLANRPNWVYPFADWGARTWLRLSGVDVNVKGLELLDPKQSYVFISNHRSYLDATPLFSYTGRRMGLIAKKELLKAPILGYGMGFVNVIAIDRSNIERAVESVRIATERLRSGISFGVCAEGTRARPGEMLPFKKGAFHMAVAAGVPIVPMALKNSDNLMGKGTGVAWPGTIEMVLMPPVETTGVSGDEGLQDLVNRVQEMIRIELGVKKLSKRQEKKMSTKSLNTTSKVAIALAIIAGLLSLSRAFYNYTQNGKWDIGKIALGIGIPCLIFAIVSAASKNETRT